MSRIAPRLVSVWVGGDALEGFATAAPTSHLKVFLPADGQIAPILPEYAPDGAVRPEDGPPPAVRTYTPRRFDEASGTLEIQFVLHGAGLRPAGLEWPVMLEWSRVVPSVGHQRKSRRADHPRRTRRAARFAPIAAI